MYIMRNKIPNNNNNFNGIKFNCHVKINLIMIYDKIIVKIIKQFDIEPTSRKSQKTKSNRQDSVQLQRTR